MAYSCASCQSTFDNQARLIAHSLPVHILRCEEDGCSYLSKSECDYQRHEARHGARRNGAVQEGTSHKPIDIPLTNRASAINIDQNIRRFCPSEDFQPAPPNLNFHRAPLTEVKANISPGAPRAIVQALVDHSQKLKISNKENEDIPIDQHRKSVGNKAADLIAFDSIPFRHTWRNRPSNSNEENTSKTTSSVSSKHHSQHNSVDSEWHVASKRHVSDTKLYACKTCEAGFDTYVALKVHQKADEHCYCRICPAFFANEAERRSHDKATHSFQCKACGATYSSLHGLSSHQVQACHCFCSPCQSFFPSPEEHESHRQAQHSFVCNEASCNNGFDTVSLLRTHQQQSHHLYCVSCDRTFESTSSLQDHDLKKHSHQCDNCALRFPRMKDLLDHQRVQNHCYCKICDIIFQDAGSLDAHASSKHAMRCPECQEPFANLGKLEVHQRIKKHLFCEPCSLAFGSKVSFDKHYTEALKHPCPGGCRLQFHTQTQLKVHQIQENHCYCAQCERLFSTARGAANHKRYSYIHSIPYYCKADKCMQRFETEHARRNHQKATGHLYCGSCSKFFDTELNYERHCQQGHKDGENYFCWACHRWWVNDKQALESHVRGTHGTGAYCSYCGINFLNQQQLMAHLAQYKHPK